MRELKPIYIFTILIVPIELIVSINGLIVGKAYLKHIIVEGITGVIINIGDLLICFYLFHKFCEAYKKIYKLRTMIVSYLKVILSPFVIFMIVMLLYDVYFEKYICNQIINIIILVILIVITYIALIRMVKNLIKKYISE
ncbi:MAG: hypothetical protein WBK20_16095 [Spirochaetota bacterium]